MRRYVILLRSLILAAVSLAAVSCMQDSDFPDPPLPPAGEVLVQLRASMPRMGRVLTRAADDAEFAVNTIDVLVFTQPGGTGEFVYQYRAVGRRLDQPNNTDVDFEALLTRSDDPIRLLTVANCPDGLLLKLTAPGTTETAAREALNNFRVDFLLNGIPMTGVAQLPSLSAATGLIRIPLMRSVAKATVAVDLNTESPAFTLTGVAIYRSYYMWQLFPDAGAVENETTAPMPIAPSVVDGSRPNLVMTDVGATQLYTGYMTEAYSPYAIGEDPATEAACLVVRGRFADDTQETYYRIDFGGEGDAENPLGQVLRNYWYQFTIVGVDGSGWTSAVDAAANPASGLRTMVTPWSGGDNTEYYFGDSQYIKLSAAETLLDAVVGHTATVTVTTSTVPFTMNSIRRPGAGTFDATGPATQTLTTDKITYTVRSIPADRPGEQKWEITATALTAESTEDYLGIHAADDLLIIYIKIARNPPPIPPDEPPVNDPAKRRIRVYSLGSNTYGSLNLSTSSGMTAILRDTNYFGPGGTVPCAGVEVLGVGSPTGSELTDLLANVDILVTTYNYTPDAATSSIIYNWMQQPGHVAFLTTDVVSTINYLREMLDPNMEWQTIAYVALPESSPYFGYGSGFEGFVPAAPTSANAPFMDGVFGNTNSCAIKDTTPYDGVTLYADITNADTRADIVPLIVSTGSRGVDNDLIMMGVDPDRRIVYIGEVLWFHRLYSWWTNTVPYDPSDYINVLWSNTWAWAVDKVMTENYDVPGMTDVE